LLDGYVDGSAGIKVAGDRRCLSARHIEKVAGDETDELIDMLVGREVLARGLVLQCRRCRRSAWYSLEDIGSSFRCGRCRLRQRVDRSWVGDQEPAWFYELAEVVHQFIEHDGDIPVLAADLHLADSRRDVQRTAELEFFPPGFDDLPPDKRQGVEVDIAAADGYRLWIGEAATDLRPDNRRLKTVRRVADGTKAHGMLFATARERFPATVVDRINQAFTRREPVVKLMSDVRRPS
jgi:hypothetical protein